MSFVLITGGSGGIGFELARAFGKRGHNLIINGSNEERLLAAKDKLENELKNKVETFVQDLSHPNGAKELYKQIKEAGLEVDILINNAGMGLLGATEKIDFEADEILMRLNMNTPVQLCKLYLPDMYKKGSGKILNIASVAAFQPGPFNATYFASKSFVLSYSQAIRFEALDKGVQVCTLCPGSTKTQFFDKEGMSTPIISDDPSMVAEYAYKKMMNKNKSVIVPGLMNQLSRLLPQKVRIHLVSMMQTLRND